MVLRPRHALMAALLSLVITRPLTAEEPKVDLNSYYRFPFSIGATYQALSPLGDYRTGFDLYDLSAVLRYPLPMFPTVQPCLQAGLLEFAPRSTDTKWEHKDLYALVGASYANRINPTFEVGADLLLGMSLSLYPSLLPESGTVGNLNFLARAGASIALVPSYHFAIELSPSLTWLSSFSPLSDFDGLVLGVGLSAHLRLGDDPDAPKPALRSLRILQGARVSVFPAMQSWYTRNPFAGLSVENTEAFPIQDIEITFYQKGYMDSPTPCASIPVLKPGESCDVGIMASFNAEVFHNEGITPLSGEIVMTYKGQGRSGEQRATISYDLQDKSGIVWDDDRKAAAFITPADGALRNYASYIRQINKDRIQPGYSETVQFACQLFNALGEIGILYQADPLQPFASVKGARMTVDSVSLPRDTLTRGTGDCDDLSVLYASLLESAGVQTALITVPGHIYVAFGTKTAGKAYGDLTPDRAMTINLDDELWIPVEITMIGRSTFIEAWRKAVEEWRACESDPALRGFFPTGKAQEIYRPIGLKETDLGLQYGSKQAVVESSARDIGRLVDAVIDAATAAAKASGSKQDRNKLGIRLARFGRYERAITAFKDAAALDPAYMSPRINLGNVYLMSKSYDKALAEFQKLEKTITEAGSPAVLWINMAECYSAMGNTSKSSEYLALAARADPALAGRYASRSQAEAAAGRAAEADAPGISPIFEE
jgi:tetratricopeptide (TPR) repeat protein